jgi:hypothetical protein
MGRSIYVGEGLRGEAWNEGAGQQSISVKEKGLVTCKFGVHHTCHYAIHPHKRTQLYRPEAIRHEHRKAEETHAVWVQVVNPQVDGFDLRSCTTRVLPQQGEYIGACGLLPVKSVYPLRRRCPLPWLRRDFRCRV